MYNTYTFRYIIHIGGGFALRESMVYVLSSGLTNHPLLRPLDHSLIRDDGLGQDSSSIFQPHLVQQQSDAPATTTSTRASIDNNSKHEYSTPIDITVDANVDNTTPLIPVVSIQPPVYLHEVHVYLDNLAHIDLIQLEQQAKDACIHICQQYTLECFYLSCDIVDIYTFTTNTTDTNNTASDSTNSTTSTDTYTEYVTVAFQVCFRSSTLALSRAQADLIRGLVETALPIALYLR